MFIVNNICIGEMYTHLNRKNQKKLKFPRLKVIKTVSENQNYKMTIG